MKKLLTLTDRDVFADAEEITNYKDFSPRPAVKIIIFDEDNKLALVGVRYRLLPGGGMEEGESSAEAAKRESLEEVGCNIEIIKEVGFTEEYRNRTKRHQTTHFLLAKVVGSKGTPQSIQEDEQGMQVDWYSLPDAIQLLEKEISEISPESYHSCFNVRTHFVVLRELADSGLITTDSGSHIVH